MTVPIIAYFSGSPCSKVAPLVLLPTLFISALISTPIIYSYREIVYKNIQMIESLNKDPLTGLLNRHSFFPKYNEALKRLQSQDKSYATLMIDIDDFKIINDTYGHIVGDFVIKQASKIIAQQIRENDLCCRFGGEEFLIFLGNVNYHSADQLSEKIQKSLEVKIIYNDCSIKITASVGMIFSSSQNISAEQLIMEADKKMYDAKANGKNQILKKKIA